MKLLLTAVNAKYIHSNPAVYSLRKYAGEEYEGHIQIAEYTINNRMEDILADIYKQKPDVIAFSCYIWNWNMIQEILTELPKILPGIPIWLGGPEVSFDAADILEQYPMLTGIMLGEGEETFKELIGYYAEENYSKELEEIAGLALPAGKTAERTITDLTSIPFLYDNLADFGNRILYYESSRGCPYRCSYCLSSIDKKVRIRDIDVVKQELQFFLDNKAAQVKFVDRTFNCSHAHAIAVWQYILEHDNGVTNFHFEISADILTEEELQILRNMRPGLVQLEIGVQSANAQTLREINRTMDLDKLETVVASIRAGNNIHQHLDLIAGLPFEDYDSFGRSFDRVYQMKPQQLQMGFLKVLKGSLMHELAGEYGICYRNKPPYEVMYTKWLSYDEVLRLKKIEEMVELYYNSSQFTHTLPHLIQKFESPFAMFEALADFYEEKGYFTMNPARAYRYHVLLSFAQRYEEEKQALYAELLTYDLYLRENVKSRPDFSKDISFYKEKIRAFYTEETEQRRYLPSYTGFDARQLTRMTHLEPFTCAVWEETEAESKATESYVLFDYSERNPLTQEAKTVIIESVN